VAETRTASTVDAVYVVYRSAIAIWTGPSIVRFLGESFWRHATLGSRIPCLPQNRRAKYPVINVGLAHSA
jgi:hypothetical protein